MAGVGFKGLLGLTLLQAGGVRLSVRAWRVATSMIGFGWPLVREA